MLARWTALGRCDAAAASLVTAGAISCHALVVERCVHIGESGCSSATASALERIRVRWRLAQQLRRSSIASRAAPGEVRGLAQRWRRVIRPSLARLTESVHRSAPVQGRASSPHAHTPCPSAAPTTPPRSPVHRGDEGQRSRRSKPKQRAGRALLWDKHLDREAHRASTARPRCRNSPTSTRPTSSKPPSGRGALPAAWRTHAPCRSREARRRRRAAIAGMPEVVDQVALARLYGEPLFALPNDLYIPPDALRGLPRGLRRPAGPAAVPDPQAELQHPRHPDGGADAAVPGLRRRDPPDQPRTGGRVPADGRDADRDQVAHAAAAQEDGRGRGGRRPARRTGAPPARIRADEAAGRLAQQHAAGSAAISARRRSTSSSRSSRAFPT